MIPSNHNAMSSDGDSASGKLGSFGRSLLTPYASSFGPLGIAPTNPLGHQPLSFVSVSVPKPVSTPSEVPPQPLENSKPLGSTAEVEASGENLHGPLDFRIPEARLREIREDSLKGAKTFWLHTLYRGPDCKRVEVYYCQNKEDSERIALKFLDQEVIGFDIEWNQYATAKDGTRENVALVQLASEERIALFHIARYSAGDEPEDLVAPSLQKIMESPDITKAGVAIKADCTRLRRYMRIDSRGLLELSHLYKLVKFSNGDVKKINKSLVPLALQVEEHLKLPLWKGQVRCSDWTVKLDDLQIECKVNPSESDAMLMLTDAASDAYAGLQLFYALEGKRKALSPSPPRPSHAELNLPIQLAKNETISTDDESSEVSDEGPSAPSDISPSIKEVACGFRDLVIEDSTASRPISKTPKTRPLQPSTSKLGPEFNAANDWIMKWRGTLSPTYKPRAQPTQLRAYALWHEQQLDVNQAASILRDPPLKDTTVAAYIVQSLLMEGLPFKRNRIADVFECLHPISKSMYAYPLRRLAWIHHPACSTRRR